MDDSVSLLIIDPQQLNFNAKTVFVDWKRIAFKSALLKKCNFNFLKVEWASSKLNLKFTKTF